MLELLAAVEPVATKSVELPVRIARIAGVAAITTEMRRQSRALSARPTRVVTVRLLADAEAPQGPLGGLDGLGAELAEELCGHRPPAGADVGER